MCAPPCWPASRTTGITVSSYQSDFDPVANSTPAITRRTASRSTVNHIVTCGPASSCAGCSTIVRSHPSCALTRSAVPPKPSTSSGSFDRISYRNPKSILESTAEYNGGCPPVRAMLSADTGLTIPSGSATEGAPRAT